jgi:predicted tellurium resistance membrane protein TerC
MQTAIFMRGRSCRTRCGSRVGGAGRPSRRRARGSCARRGRSGEAEKYTGPQTGPANLDRRVSGPADHARAGSRPERESTRPQPRPESAVAPPVAARDRQAAAVSGRVSHSPSPRMAMDLLTDPQAWIALATLLALEIVLGVDNIVFISILAGKLPVAQRAKARTLGLGLALITRILLLLSLSWMIRLTSPLFTVVGNAISGRDLLLIVGGLFLLGKSTHEIHDRLEGEEGHSSARVPASFAAVIVQILLLDIVFSLDSVITAVGMVDRLEIMITAVVLAMIVMIAFAGLIGDFVDRHPTVKMLALAFLLLIGTNLVAEGLGQHIPKGYIYFAMAF